MARYKLIKEYPGSQPKGTIAYSGHRVSAYKDMKYKLKNKGKTINYIFFSAEYIENHPKFWKKLD